MWGIGIILILLINSTINGSRMMTTLGNVYETPARCNLTTPLVQTFAELQLTGICSKMTGLANGCCTTQFEKTIPPFGDYCSSTSCVTKFAEYWCNRGCALDIDFCFDATYVNDLITACTPDCLSLFFNNTEHKYLASDATTLWNDDGLTLDATCSVNHLAFAYTFGAPSANSFTTYWQSNAVANGDPIVFLGTGYVKFTVLSTSSLPPFWAVKVYVNNELRGEAVSQFGLWTASGSAWSTDIYYYIQDPSIFVGTIKFEHSVKNNDGVGVVTGSPTTHNATLGDSYVAPTSLESIEHCLQNETGTSGQALIGQLVSNITTIFCGCDTCSSLKYGTAPTEVETLTISKANTYSFFSSSITVTNLIAPALKAFYFTKSRLVFASDFSTGNNLNFTGNSETGNSFSLSKSSTYTFSNSGYVLLKDISGFINGTTTSEKSWGLRNATRLDINKASFSLPTLDVCSVSGIGDSTSPSLLIGQDSIVTATAQTIIRRGWATVSQNAKFLSNIVLINEDESCATTDPTFVTSSSKFYALQFTKLSQAWDNRTSLLLSSGGTVGSGSIDVGKDTVFAIDTTRSYGSAVISGTTLPFCGTTNNETTTTLTVQEGGYLVFKNVGASSNPFNIYGPIDANTNSVFGVELLDGAVWSTLAITKPLLRYTVVSGSTTLCQAALPESFLNEATIVNCPSTRTCSLEAVYETELGSICRLNLKMSQLVSNLTSYNQTSANTYSITMQQDCDWPTTNKQFVKAIMQYHIGDSAYPPIIEEQILLITKICGSVTMRFKCKSTTIALADALCQRIVDDANNKYSSLSRALNAYQAIKSGSYPTGSDDGIYGLYALMFIPCCLACILVCYYKGKQKKADDQYLQDTATFSSLAGGKPVQKSVPPMPYEQAYLPQENYQPYPPQQPTFPVQQPAFPQQYPEYVAPGYGYP